MDSVQQFFLWNWSHFHHGAVIPISAAALVLLRLEEWLTGCSLTRTTLPTNLAACGPMPPNLPPPATLPAWSAGQGSFQKWEQLHFELWKGWWKRRKGRKGGGGGGSPLQAGGGRGWPVSSGGGVGGGGQPVADVDMDDAAAITRSGVHARQD